MKVASFVAVTVVVLILRLTVVAMVFWIGATIATVTVPLGDLIGAAVAIVGAHWALTFTIEITLRQDRPRW